VQTLEQHQRLGEAVTQLRQVLVQQPDTPQAWLTLGAYLLELQEPGEATRALQTYLNNPGPSDADGGNGPASALAEEDDREDRGQRRLDYAWMLMAEAQLQQGHLKEAGAWLDRIDPARVDLPLLVRRGQLMARQGEVAAARTLVREAPVRGTPTPRGRMLAEVQILREAQQWQAAYDLVLAGVRSEPDDDGLIYELSMLAERLGRFDDMEVLLKRVMALKPDDAHAYNALGYSLAERNIRLGEAQTLVRRAAELAPEDPFIIDSLGWVAFRQGDLETALRLLTRSHTARPHVEVATHLGEVLWTLGRRDEALRVWREGQAREANNEVLRATLRRLRVSL
jgi:Flp pilus assembly protein TadD